MQAPRLPSFIRGTRQRPRGLKYKPRYYDPEKEAFEERVAEIRMKYEGQDQESALRKASMQRNIETNRYRRSIANNGRSQIIRLGIILLLLIGISFYIINFIDILN